MEKQKIAPQPTQAPRPPILGEQIAPRPPILGETEGRSKPFPAPQNWGGGASSPAPHYWGGGAIHIDGDAVHFADCVAVNGFLERDARLLVAGSYPAKDLTVTEADLDALVAHFSEPVPVKVEHIDSPLDPLGLVMSIRRQGNELRGRVKFPAEMAAFLASRDAHKLSVGLLKGPTWKLLEASLTRAPHVPTATLLSDNERAELVELRAQARRMTADAHIGELKLLGQVVPAIEPLARALLMADETQTVTLSDGAAPQGVAQTTLALLRALPPLVHWSELAPAQAGRATLSAGASGAAASEAEREWTEEEKEIMRRLGVSPEDVAREMGRG